MPETNVLLLYLLAFFLHHPPPLPETVLIDRPETGNPDGSSISGAVYPTWQFAWQLLSPGFRFIFILENIKSVMRKANEKHADKFEANIPLKGQYYEVLPPGPQ